MTTKFVVSAHLLNGSNVVFINKEHIKNVETQTFSDVDVYLSEQDITDLYNRMMEERANNELKTTIV